METVPFWKVQGGGNDFVAFDNRTLRLPVAVMPTWARKLCDRRFGVGADGVFWLSAGTPVRWDFYNADGSRAPMCGNGARCAGLLAVLLGFVPHDAVDDAAATFPLGTDRGPVALTVPTSDATAWARTVRARLPPVSRMTLNAAHCNGRAVHFVDTGVPHAVVVIVDSSSSSGAKECLLALQLRAEALAVRAALPESMRSTNVNFAVVELPCSLRVRTFERGVEDETLACGTGSAAVAVVARALGIVDVASPSTSIAVAGGVSIAVSCAQDFVAIEGPASVVFQGTLTPTSFDLPLA